jgi:hypothetical protein
MHTLSRIPSTDGQVSVSKTVTGRDGYIVAQALYWFIREQQKLPEEQFEWSNTEDAKLILLTLWPGLVRVFTSADQFWDRTPARLQLEKYEQMMPTLRAADNNLRR